MNTRELCRYYFIIRIVWLFWDKGCWALKRDAWKSTVFLCSHDTAKGSVSISHRLEIVFKSLRLKWRFHTISIRYRVNTTVQCFVTFLCCFQVVQASCEHIKADFHPAFFVARVTFLLFKWTDSFSPHFTWKLGREKKKVARAIFLLFKLNSFPLHSTWKLRRQIQVAHAIKKAEWKSALLL